MQVRGRHRIRVIRAPLTVETLAWHRGDCGPSHDREPEWITQLALLRAMADVVQERVDASAAVQGSCGCWRPAARASTTVT